MGYEVNQVGWVLLKPPFSAFALRQSKYYESFGQNYYIRNILKTFLFIFKGLSIAVLRTKSGKTVRCVQLNELNSQGKRVEE